MTIAALTTFETIRQGQSLFSPDEALTAMAAQGDALLVYADEATTTEDETTQAVRALFDGFDLAATLRPDTLEGIRAMARLLALKATFEGSYSDPENALAMALVTALGVPVPAPLPALGRLS